VHTLTAVARDAAGNTKTSDSVTITVKNTVLDTNSTSITQPQPSSVTSPKSTVTKKTPIKSNTGTLTPTVTQKKVSKTSVKSSATTTPPFDLLSPGASTSKIDIATPKTSSWFEIIFVKTMEQIIAGAQAVFEMIGGMF
jgi:hypothetical protein